MTIVIPIKDPETIEQALFFNDYVFPKCTAIRIDITTRKMVAIEMHENDYFWLMVSLLRDNEEEQL